MKNPKRMSHEELLIAYMDIMCELFKRGLAKPDECGWKRIETEDAPEVKVEYLEEETLNEAGSQ